MSNATEKCFIWHKISNGGAFLYVREQSKRFQSNC